MLRGGVRGLQPRPALGRQGRRPVQDHGVDRRVVNGVLRGVTRSS